VNKIEKLKAAKNGLDTLEDIYRYARLGFASIPEEEYDLLKWYGLFHRRQTPGYFMMRLRISNGILSTTQLRTIAGISRDFGRGVGDITSRQNIQLRWIEIEHVPEIFERLHSVGMTSQQTGMDNFRNVTGCPMAGLHCDELLDASPLVQATALALLGREFSNLPRKFNISINGCRHDCAEAQGNDIGMTPATLQVNGRTIVGFNVFVGGALGGKTPVFAEPLDVFVRPEQVIALCRAILTVFRDHGRRESRNEARLKWLLTEWGLPRFRAEVERVFGQPLHPAGKNELLTYGGDHIGIQPQRQPGLCTVGLLVPVGRITADQLLALADLADTYGAREVRLTLNQNVLIPHIPSECLPRLMAEPLLQEWSPCPSAIMRGLTTCTGKDYCHFALNDTKGYALMIGRELEKRLVTNGHAIHLNVSGCIHACGRHRARDFGLMATRVRQGQNIVDGFEVFSGGQLGEAAKIAELAYSDVTVDRVVEVLAQEIAAQHGLEIRNS